jgi:hypothetical protein
MNVRRDTAREEDEDKTAQHVSRSSIAHRVRYGIRVRAYAPHRRVDARMGA